MTNELLFNFDSFRNGDIVFKITAISTRHHSKVRDVGMVSTYSDYISRIQSHTPTPLLGEVSLEKRFAYLFGCLNFAGYNIARDEIFTFWIRKVGTDEWVKWFEVLPTTYSVY